MSNRYKGGIISATPPTTSKASASGAWTLEQQMQAQGAGTWPYAGPTYIEDVFSTWLYTGNSSTQTITNGVDLSTYGGMVWLKSRAAAGGGSAAFNVLSDTARGIANTLVSSNTLAQNLSTNQAVNSVSSTGFVLANNADTNLSGVAEVSWTFRKQPKFFDIVTWTGDATANRLITHNLGAIPAVIMIKATSTTGSWYVSIRSSGLNGDTTDFANVGLGLESTSARDSSFLGTSQATAWTSTQFTLYATGARTNVNGVTYVAYIFAHNAGGFGLTGTDNVISCGSWTATGGGVADVINLGFEPQWILWKRSNSTGGNWYISDNMRGMPVQGSSGTGQKLLYPNLSDAEYGDYGIDPTSTGFNALYGATGNQFIYIAIRRGPMKVPTTGTSVFSPITSSAATGTNQTTGFPVDMQIKAARTTALTKTVADRLRGVGTTPTSDIGLRLSTNLTSAETASSAGGASKNWTNTGFANPSDTGGISAIYWNWGRAPSFMDIVCYTGTGSSPLNVSHNLAAVPEMMIVKDRGNADSWYVYHANASGTPQGSYLTLNSSGAVASSTGPWGNTLPTSSVFTVGATNNTSTYKYVAYLFATCAGVSKVGSYTGTGATQTISCGFTGGARFVLIRRTDTSGNNWDVWDTARGMVAGTDPFIPLNTTAVETNANTIYTATGGFQIAGASVNASGGTYIFLAIA